MLSKHKKLPNVDPFYIPFSNQIFNLHFSSINNSAEFVSETVKDNRESVDILSETLNKINNKKKDIKIR